MNQEFQHSVESRLIEVTIYQIHTIQFVSIVNLVQTQLIQAADVLSTSYIRQVADASSER
jgi:hypothetical protein